MFGSTKRAILWILAWTMTSLLSILILPLLAVLFISQKSSSSKRPSNLARGTKQCLENVCFVKRSRTESKFGNKYSRVQAFETEKKAFVKSISKQGTGPCSVTYSTLHYPPRSGSLMDLPCSPTHESWGSIS